MVTYFADSDCDVSSEEAASLGFKLISMPYTFGDKEIFPYENGNEFHPEEFYASLREGAMPKTSGLSPEKYAEYFEPEFKAGNDVFYAHFSSVMSSTFNAMHLAVEELKEKYPERKFYSLDLKSITSLARAILVDISGLIKDGKSPEEIIAIAKKEIIPHYALYAFADDLSFFRRSGRLSGIQSFMGTLIGAKPIISIDDDGKMGAIGKEVGRKKALRRILEEMERLGEGVENHPVYICHSDCPALVEEMKGLILLHYPKAKIDIVPINPTAGVHCGPTCLGVVFHSKGRR